MTNRLLTTRRRRAAALVAVAVLGGCGGGSDDGDAMGDGAASDGSTTTTSITLSPTAPGATGSVPPGGAAGPGAPGGTAAPGGAPSEPGASGPTTTKPPLKLTARVATACVRPGGVQTLTVESEPKTPIAYASEYADGKTGMDADYYGGANAGATDEKGTYVSTWTIAPTAPRGLVKVNVYGNHNYYEMAERVVTFQLSDATGTCS